MSYSYIGKLIEAVRVNQRISEETVSRGICDLGTYGRLERGEDIGNIHVVRLVLQRLGMSAGMAGRYLLRDEYDEMSARLSILEYLKDGQLMEAENAVKKYERCYCKSDRLNIQFMEYMSARIAELHGDFETALALYEHTVRYTVEDYFCIESGCISMYEYFMLTNVARITAKLGRTDEAVDLYDRLLAYCKNRKLDQLTMACIYPKTICEVLSINSPQNMGVYAGRQWLEECDSALRMLRDASRLHFICPLLKNRHILSEISGKQSDLQWEEFLEHYEWLRDKYGVEGELLEWYPYYNSDWGFYPVEKLIDERRKLYGITIEKLGEGVCTPETVSRIINRRVSPKRSTVEALLDKLGLKGVLEENVIVSDDYDAYMIWDDIVNSEKIGDVVTCRRLYDRLKGKLDANIAVNEAVLNYMHLGLEFMGTEENDYERYAHIHEKMLGFSIEDTKKITIFTEIELMIIKRYFYCKDKIKDYANLQIYECLCEKYINNSGVCRAFAGDAAGILSSCASYTGNMGKFEISNVYSKKGIELEMNCERMHLLSNIIYCIPWNHVESGKTASEDDIKLCKCAYWIAWVFRDDKRMSLYSRWIDNHGRK